MNKRAKQKNFTPESVASAINGVFASLYWVPSQYIWTENVETDAITTDVLSGEIYFGKLKGIIKTIDQTIGLLVTAGEATKKLTKIPIVEVKPILDVCVIENLKHEADNLRTLRIKLIDLKGHLSTVDAAAKFSKFSVPENTSRLSVLVNKLEFLATIYGSSQMDSLRPPSVKGAAQGGGMAQVKQKIQENDALAYKVRKQNRNVYGRRLMFARMKEFKAMVASKVGNPTPISRFAMDHLDLMTDLKQKQHSLVGKLDENGRGLMEKLRGLQLENSSSFRGGSVN